MTALPVSSSAPYIKGQIQLLQAKCVMKQARIDAYAARMKAERELVEWICGWWQDVINGDGTEELRTYMKAHEEQETADVEWMRVELQEMVAQVEIWKAQLEIIERNPGSGLIT